jgi:hypothetical protein
LLAFAPFFLLLLRQTIGKLSLFACHHGPAAATHCRHHQPDSSLLLLPLPVNVVSATHNPTPMLFLPPTTGCRRPLRHPQCDTDVVSATHDATPTLSPPPTTRCQRHLRHPRRDANVVFATHDVTPTLSPPLTMQSQRCLCHPRRDTDAVSALRHPRCLNVLLLYLTCNYFTFCLPPLVLPHLFFD